MLASSQGSTHLLNVVHFEKLGGAWGWGYTGKLTVAASGQTMRKPLTADIINKMRKLYLRLTWKLYGTDSVILANNPIPTLTSCQYTSLGWPPQPMPPSPSTANYVPLPMTNISGLVLDLGLSAGCSKLFNIKSWEWPVVNVVSFNMMKLHILYYKTISIPIQHTE